MNNTAQELSKLDLEHIWHPCSQMSEYDSVLAIKRGDGAVLYGYDEKAYIDCISSWWVNIFGHGNAYIAAKIADAVKKAGIKLNPKKMDELVDDITEEIEKEL